MTASLKALLAGVIDYAGLYPPASLPVDEAVRCWRRYRDDEKWWMLGRFVCPADKVESIGFEALGWEAGDGGISTVCSRDSKTPFADVLRSLGHSPSDWIESIEIAAAESLPCSLTVYREFRLDRLDHATAEGVALKFRTGGNVAGAFPSSGDLSRVIAACRDAGVPWKATAGLHHPLPNLDASGGRAHGFINLLTASVLAHARGIDRLAIQAILDDENPQSFRFDDAGLAWREFTATTAEIAKSRRESLRSFGCCSFTEPRDNLAGLNWFRLGSGLG